MTNELCTKIISGSSHFNEQSVKTTSTNLSNSSSSSNSNVSLEKRSSHHHHHHNFHNHTSACCGVTGHHSLLFGTTTRSSALQESSLMGADSSMRCTLRRGRPNTPKSGLSMEYRIRKSSVPNTPECKLPSSSSFSSSNQVCLH